MSDLRIYYSSMAGNHYVDCECSRWDVSNYSLTTETWLDKTDLKTLRDNITPGAVGELYKVLGEPTYYDKTWEGENTLRLFPLTGTNSTITERRRDTLLYVKSISDVPIKGPSGWINVKIEGYISGGQDL